VNLGLVANIQLLLCSGQAITTLAEKIKDQATKEAKHIQSHLQLTRCVEIVILFLFLRVSLM
jgi:hypothetical protein